MTNHHEVTIVLEGTCPVDEFTSPRDSFEELMRHLFGEEWESVEEYYVKDYKVRVISDDD